MTRGISTLLGAAVAGILLWVATQFDRGTVGGYWAFYGVVAAAGLTMALSQLLGGWTKWGWPQISLNVFLIGFLPVLVVGGWILVASQPDGNWVRDHVQSWSGDLGVRDVVFTVNDLLGAIAFGIGLVFGFTFDTAGPRLRPAPAPAGEPVARDTDIDAPTSAERTEVRRAEVEREDVPPDERERVPSRE